jgi:hypothetical protein
MSTNPHADPDGSASRVDADRTDRSTPDTIDRHRDGDGTSTYRDDRNPPVSTYGRREVVEREREQHGGIKIGSAFFGWLTATGTAVLLTALLAAAGTAIGLSTGTDADDAASAAADDPTTIGVIGAVALLLVLFVSYYCGGYVAGRMARFDGAKQGLAVWLWALVIAVVVAVLGAVAGSKFNVLANLNSFPRIPIGEGDLSTAGILAAIGVAVASLAGAILGGIAGMRFHRRVDRTGFGDD